MPAIENDSMSVPSECDSMGQEGSNELGNFSMVVQVDKREGDGVLVRSVLDPGYTS